MSMYDKFWKNVILPIGIRKWYYLLIVVEGNDKQQGLFVHTQNQYFQNDPWWRYFLKNIYRGGNTSSVLVEGQNRENMFVCKCICISEDMA